MYALLSLFCLHLFSMQLESIEALEQFMRKHRKDYVDPLRTTEQERDSIEHEVSRGNASRFSLFFFLTIKASGFSVC